MTSEFTAGDPVIYTGPSLTLHDQPATVVEVHSSGEIYDIRFDDMGLPQLHACCAEHLTAAPVATASTALTISGNAIAELCHGAAAAAGWWTDLKTGESLIGKRNVPEMLCLIHSEISEGLEGYRKNLMDDHLPQYPMLAVELADAVIRIGDLAGSLGYPLGEIIAAKMAYNANRPDHKPENRRAAGGKAI